jgi:DNA repair exonuclease SbcCD nuclease subunit
MTPLRFLHIGDLHLGRNERNADRIRALDQIITEGLAQPLAAWLIPGDLDDAMMTVFDKNAISVRVVRMANHAPVVILYGNHDHPGDLDFLALLKATYPIYVVAAPHVLRVPLADGAHTAAIFGFPYPSRQGLVAAGTPTERIPHAAREALDAIFMVAAADLAQAVTEGCIPLMIGHVNVGGSTMSSGQPNIGKEIELDPVLLDRLGPIYKGLNHIHKAQEIGGAHYAGSICRLDWGEIEEKRYLTIEYEPGWEERTWLYEVASHPVDVAKMFHVEGTLTRDGFRLSEACAADADIERRYHAGDWTGAEVRVRYRFAAAEREALTFDLVTAPFVGATRILPDPIPTHTRAVRAPEVAAARTAEEKLAAFVTSAGATWTDSLAVKFALLQIPDGTAFLNQLEHDLTGARPADTDGADALPLMEATR